MKRITVDWHRPNGLDIKFDIYTDQTIEDLHDSFIDWCIKTKIWTAESLCRFLRKRFRKARILSSEQYINLIANQFVNKTGYKKYF